MRTTSDTIHTLRWGYQAEVNRVQFGRQQSITRSSRRHCEESKFHSVRHKKMCNSRMSDVPHHSRTGTAERVNASEEEGKQESVNKELYKISYGKLARN